MMHRNDNNEQYGYTEFYETHVDDTYVNVIVSHDNSMDFPHFRQRVRVGVRGKGTKRVRLHTVGVR